jgi:cytochrome b6-f complex iron-sulfur subunit
MDRRTFLQWVGVGAIAQSLPLALIACSPEPAANDTNDTNTTAGADAPAIDKTIRPDGFQALGTTTELAAEGSITDLTHAPEAVIIFTDPNGQLTALNARCPHQGCSVEWDAEGQILNCPCHGSTFSPDGTVAQGPAQASLTAFEAQVEGELILVKVN